MLKNISHRNLVKKLKVLGFNGPYSGGRHMFMQKHQLSLHIPNPHKGDISRFLLSEILRQAGISKKQWNNTK